MTLRTGTVDWEDFGIYGNGHSLPTDWQHVVSLGDWGGYDWTTLHVFWGPTERQFFWHGDFGCSCNDWGDGLRSASDFQVGSKGDLVRALRSFAYEYLGVGSALDAVAAVQRFRGEVRR